MAGGAGGEGLEGCRNTGNADTAPITTMFSETPSMFQLFQGKIS